MSLENGNRTVNVSLSNIEDQTAALLYMSGAASDNEDISSIKFGDIVTDAEGRQIVPVTFNYIRRKVVPETEKKS